MRNRLLSMVALVVFAAAVLAAASADVTAGPASPSLAARATGCPEARLSSRYVKRVSRALRSRRDSWGRRLLAAPNGPTYEHARRFLTPLFIARKRNGRLLTDSGAHYTHFSQPPNTRGATSVGLHVADGSQIISRRAHRREMLPGGGGPGREREGADLRGHGR